MEPIPPQPGNLRDPRYFVGRRRTTEQARERLLAGASLSLSDPRRMGKTYWMHYFATTQDKVFNPFIIDYEGVYTIEDFIDDPDEFGWFGHLLTRVDRYYGQDTDTAQRILDSALRHDSSWTTVDDLPQAPGTMKVIDALVSDHYLEARGRSVRWRYPALAYIWARRRRTWDRP